MLLNSGLYLGISRGPIATVFLWSEDSRRVYSGNLDVLFCAAQQCIFKIGMAGLIFVSCCAETVFLNKKTVRQNAPFEIMLCGCDAVGGLSSGIERYHVVYYGIFPSVCARYCSNLWALWKEMLALQLTQPSTKGGLFHLFYAASGPRFFLLVHIGLFWVRLEIHKAVL
ncbi:hypothetical protein [Paraburkholderia sacchari]|uniref:hypothetical protein n=1 Tax=Paraburkholderia sacchari TaxID=159450 RepID=UPI001BCA8911|nr:hypothetical protein [Paraburkholderia sacchari]